MISLKQYLKAINYKITEGTRYCWECYGYNARYLDSFEDDRYHASAIFDQGNQVVYEAYLYDYIKNKAYRWMNPKYRAAHAHEANKKGIDPDIAWHDRDEEVLFIELTEEDLLKKIKKAVRSV